MQVKKLMITGLVAFIVASLGVLTILLLRQDTQAPPRPPAEEKLPDAVIVFCFHGKARSAKCEKIEKYTHEVLEKSFAAPLKDGRLVWRVLNYESPKNASFVSDFMVKKTCIVLADARTNGSGTAKNLEKKVWELVDKKDAFDEYIRGAVREALE